MGHGTVAAAMTMTIRGVATRTKATHETATTTRIQGLTKDTRRTMMTISRKLTTWVEALLIVMFMATWFLSVRITDEEHEQLNAEIRDAMSGLDCGPEPDDN
jgi:type VI protein secretion system component VasF